MLFCGHTGMSGAIPEVEFQQQSSADHKNEKNHEKIKWSYEIKASE